MKNWHTILYNLLKFHKQTLLGETLRTFIWINTILEIEKSSKSQNIGLIRRAKAHITSILIENKIIYIQLLEQTEQSAYFRDIEAQSLIYWELCVLRSELDEEIKILACFRISLSRSSK